MGDFFNARSQERDLFFNSFGNDIGTRLDRLKFEFEAMENGTILEEPEPGDDIDGIHTTLESKVNDEIHKNYFAGETEHQEDDSKRTRSYSFAFQRAFSTVSLMTNFKANFWRHRKSKKHDKSENGNAEGGKQRRSSTSSEKNNNAAPTIKVNGESEGRASIYSTIPRLNGNKVSRSHTMSPKTKRTDELVPGEIEPLERSESGNIYSPPVMVDGQLVYDYQYSTPAEGSPGHKSPKASKLHRRNSVSRFLRLRKSPRKSPKGSTSTPIKALYQKTVLSQSEPNHMNNVGKNGRLPSTASNGEDAKKNSPEKST